MSVGAFHWSSVLALGLKGARFVAGVYPTPSADSKHHSVLDLYQITYTVTESTINTKTNNDTCTELPATDT